MADLFTAISVHVMSLILSFAEEPVLQDWQIYDGRGLANTVQ